MKKMSIRMKESKGKDTSQDYQNDLLICISASVEHDAKI